MNYNKLKLQIYVLGKSNIMDAISFVMGAKAESLRVKQLNELIYSKFGGVPIEHRC